MLHSSCVIFRLMDITGEVPKMINVLLVRSGYYMNTFPHIVHQIRGTLMTVSTNHLLRDGVNLRPGSNANASPCVPLKHKQMHLNFF
jgi:hypothetical protein